MALKKVDESIFWIKSIEIEFQGFFTLRAYGISV
jgi:hypothetical protein